MNNSERYKKTFINSLSVDKNLNLEKLKYNDIQEWDSIGHMSLISGLEEEFKVTFETDQIINFSSFKKEKILYKLGGLAQDFSDVF